MAISAGFQVPGMAFDEFLDALFEDGRVRVPGPAPLAEDELAAAENVISDFERRYRLELPGEPPPLSLAAARWAAERFYRACQLAVFRDLPAEAVAQETAQRLAGVPDASAHYSADLVFRLLPDLLRFGRGAAERDPLVEHLLALCRDWPLSSVGVENVGEVSVAGFVANGCLLRLYVDRILARGDAARLGDGRVREAVRAALGEHVEPRGKLAAALRETEPVPDA